MMAPISISPFPSIGEEETERHRWPQETHERLHAVAQLQPWAHQVRQPGHLHHRDLQEGRRDVATAGQRREGGDRTNEHPQTLCDLNQLFVSYLSYPLLDIFLPCLFRSGRWRLLRPSGSMTKQRRSTKRAAERQPLCPRSKSRSSMFFCLFYWCASPYLPP